MEQVRPLKMEIVLFIGMFLALVIIATIYFVSLNNAYVKHEVNTGVSGNSTLDFTRGIIVSVAQLIRSTDDCKVVSVNYANTTRRLVDVDCVRALLQQQNITLRRG